KQMHALLNEDGTLLVTVPAFPALWGTHDVVTHHKRRYLKGTLRSVVEQAGFHVDYMAYFNFFLFPVAYVRRMVARITGAPEASDMNLPLWPVNKALRVVFESEKYILPHVGFPFGLSLICTARKATSPKAALK